MRTLPLTETSKVTLNGSGNGTCPPIGPTSSGETWNVSLISVQCSTNHVESIAQVFINGLLIGTTLTGSTGDTDSAINQNIANNQQVTATWTGGDPGSVATMTVFGSKVVG